MGGVVGTARIVKKMFCHFRYITTHISRFNLQYHFKTQELHQNQENKILYSIFVSEFHTDFNFKFDLRRSDFRN